jgi:predicted flap endonuclease-1-like 5' DNA nuclease/predicted  nucleic acid-binding Zn-ribbon protein
MWFLLLQIFFLLILAAALGAAATFWWMKQRYEDVTDTHTDLLAQTDRLKKLSDMPDREDLKAALENLAARISALKPDLAPVNDRLGLLERAVRGITIPEPDLKPFGQKLDVIEAHLRAPDIGLDQLRERAANIEHRVSAVSESVSRLSNTDLKPLEARIADLENLMLSWKAPEVDLGPVHSELATLGLSLSELRSGADNARKSDIATLTAKLAEVSTAVGALRPLQGMLSDIEHAVTTIDRQQVDLQPLHLRFAQIETALGSLRTELEENQWRAIEPVQRGVAGMQEALQGMPGPDLDPVVNAVLSIDSREDLAAVENRLTAIEYSLAAVHHMLRARTDGGLARAEMAWHTRPAPNPPQPANGETRPGQSGPMRPPQEVDPINPVRRQGAQANLLIEPAFGPPDDLEQLNGVGPILAGLLNDTGIYYYWQIAEWTPDEAAWVDSQLMYFKGRIKRDDWVGHARTLATQPASAKRPSGPTGRA